MPDGRSGADGGDGDGEAGDRRGTDAAGGPGDVPTDRSSPVGEPVVRGDRSVAGRHADRAVEFDPEDPESLRSAAETVRAFAAGTDGRPGTAAGDADPPPWARDTSAAELAVLRAAAAAAALVRGTGSYRRAADRATRATVDGDGTGDAGDDGDADDDADDAGDGAEGDGDADGAVSVSFVRTWARVHDLPRSIRRAVAAGDIAPSAAKQIARVGGRDRFLLAWATVDDDLTVREVRSAASAVADGTPAPVALREVGATPGELTVDLPPDTYAELRRRAVLADRPPSAVVADALDEYLDGDADPR